MISYFLDHTNLKPASSQGVTGQTVASDALTKAPATLKDINQVQKTVGKKMTGVQDGQSSQETILKATGIMRRERLQSLSNKMGSSWRPSLQPQCGEASEFARILPDEFLQRIRAGQSRPSEADKKKTQQARRKAKEYGKENQEIFYIKDKQKAKRYHWLC